MYILLLKEGGCDFQAIEADKVDLKDVQEMVGGWVEIHRVKIGKKSFLVAMDEEGKLKRKKPTGLLVGNGCKDVMVGNIVLMKNNFKGMTLADAKMIVEEANKMQALICRV